MSDKQAEAQPTAAETATPEEQGKALADELLGIVQENGSTTEAHGSTPTEEAKQREIAAARTRIHHMGLARAMADIEDPGHTAAAEIQTKAEDLASETVATADEVAAKAERSAKYHKGRKNVDKQATAEARAESVRADAAVRADELKMEAGAESEAAVAEARSNSERTHDAFVTEATKDYVEDRDVALASAKAEKFARDQLLELKKQPVPENESLREQRNREALTASLKGRLRADSDAAGTAETERQALVDAKLQAKFTDTSRYLRDLTGVPEGTLSDPIDGKMEGAETLTKELLRSLGIDRSQEPDRAVRHGSIFSRNKFIDSYRSYQGNDKPELNGMVFVERYNEKTGQLVRVDAVKAVRPDKRSRRSERKWRDQVDEKLEQIREAKDIALPASKKGDRLNVPDGIGGGSYGAILASHGMSAESTNSLKRKPKRKGGGFWGMIFGG